jgi:hypothetical protein
MWQSYGLGINCIEDFHKDSGTVLGITLSDHPDLRSRVTAMNKAVGETDILKEVAFFKQQYADEQDELKVDLIMSGRGVYNTYINNRLGLTRIDYTNSTVKSGNTGFGEDVAFEYDGVKYRWVVDDYIESGRLYILNTASNNWKHYGVPNLDFVPRKGAKMEDGTPLVSEITWYNSWMGGTSDIWRRVDSGTQTTSLRAAEWVMFSQIAPFDPRGITFTGCTETIGSAA